MSYPEGFAAWALEKRNAYFASEAKAYRKTNVGLSKNLVLGSAEHVLYAKSLPTPLIIQPSPFVWKDPATIKRREWLWGGHLIRRFVSATVATAGVGKSTFELAAAISMVTHQPILGPQASSALRTWYWNGEDPVQEIERRVAAICLHYGITREDIASRLFLDSGRNQEIIIAKSERAGFSIAFPVVNALKEAIKKNEIDVLIVDPFISSHWVSENDNGAIDAVAKEWAAIADETGCAIELVHHVRKTGGAEITAEDGRGASALVATARSVRVLNVMSADEATRAGVEQRRSYFRSDNGKSNLTPPSESSDWFKIVSIGLGNSVDGPEDWVGVAEPWKWPSAFEGLNTADLQNVQKKLSEGDYAESSRAANWAGYAVAEVLDIAVDEPTGKARVKSLLKTWLKNKVLRIQTCRNPRTGRDQRVIVAGERL